MSNKDDEERGQTKSISFNHLCQDKDKQHKYDSNVQKYDNILKINMTNWLFLKKKI